MDISDMGEKHLMKEHLGFNVFTVYMTNKVIKVISIMLSVWCGKTFF